MPSTYRSGGMMNEKKTEKRSNKKEKKKEKKPSWFGSAEALNAKRKRKKILDEYAGMCD